jgi:predicted tellurium resistance membrane protein TerC
VVLRLIYVFAICILLPNNPVVFNVKGAVLVSHFVKTLIRRHKFVFVRSPILFGWSNREE